MMTQRLLSCVAGTAALALAACDGAVVNRSEGASVYTGYLYAQSQAADGTNAVVVRNSPFAPDVVVRALQDRYRGDQYRFALGPSPAGWNGYTVILAFGGAPVGNQNLCQNPNLPLPVTASGRTALIGEYCVGSILVSEATGWTSAVNGPEDPRFKNLVGDVVAELFSYQARYDKHGSGIPR
ncbi:MAG: hypothetical protein JO128_06885 [Alphaproteobacteria bacterium]|nr:hypothetical protein [Alphaproteobacteria bacterium]